MIKILTPFLFIQICILSANAQTPIYSSDMPNAGDSIKISIAGGIGTSDATLTGANYTWDFSALTPNSSRFEKYDSPFSFQIPYNYIFNPTNTSYGKNNPQRTGAVATFSITAAYDFYKETTANFIQVGAAYTINGTPIPFIYSPADTIYRFPMNYLNTDSCNYKYGLGVPTFGYYGQKGHRVNVVDGWGNITTPYGTFSALRLKSTVTSIDTVYYASLFFGTNLPMQTKHEYKWLTTGLKIPLLEIDANVIAGNETITNVAYIDSVSRVGITEINNIANISVFPNPASDQLVLQYHMVSAATVKISICNVLGETMTIVENGKMAIGENLNVINLKELKLSEGIYFVNFESNGSREIKKIIISK